MDLKRALSDFPQPHFPRRRDRLDYPFAMTRSLQRFAEWAHWMSVLARTFRNKSASQSTTKSHTFGVFRADNHGKNFMNGNVCERSIERSREARCSQSRSNQWRCAIERASCLQENDAPSAYELPSDRMWQTVASLFLCRHFQDRSGLILGRSPHPARPRS